jgi:hypothetical protein
MFILNFSKPLTDLSGQSFIDEQGNDMTVNRTLANNLSRCTTFGDYVKLMEWARDLWKGNPITIDKSDKATLVKLVKDFKIYPIVKEQIMQVIDAAVENSN